MTLTSRILEKNLGRGARDHTLLKDERDFCQVYVAICLCCNITGVA